VHTAFVSATTALGSSLRLQPSHFHGCYIDAKFTVTFREQSVRWPKAGRLIGIPDAALKLG
jgi:hypothetical protein